MTDTPEVKRTKNRSTAYPGIPLGEAVDATKLLRESYGSTAFSRDNAAVALGYKGVNGASSTKIAACVHFGLLVRESNVYKQSQLADQVFVAMSDDERSAAIRTAFTNPTLYRKLAEEYNGKALPRMLENILVRQYGITERAAKEAASGFIESAEYVGVLQNGVIKLGETSEVEAEPLAHDNNFDHSRAHWASAPHHGPQPTGNLPVTIPGTEVTILFPAKYSFELSTGAFSAGIKQFAEDIKVVQDASPEVDQAATEAPGQAALT